MRPYYRNYSKEALQLAVELVKSKKGSSYDAEKLYGIPRRTILNKVNNLHRDKPGPPFRLSDEEEMEFVEMLVAAGDSGCPFSKLQLRTAVYKFLKKNNRTSIFKDKLPGSCWVNSFLDRHKDRLPLNSVQNMKKPGVK